MLLGAIILPVAATAQEAAFEKAAKTPGVNYVYLSESTLASINPADLGMEIARVAQELKTVDLLTADGTGNVSSAVSTLRECTQQMEKLISKADDEQEINIYGVREGDHFSKLLVMMVASNEGNPHMSAIQLTGVIDPDDLKQIAY